MMRTACLFVVFLLAVGAWAETHSVTLEIPDCEVWWGAAVGDANQMPFGSSLYVLDQTGNTRRNQSQPMMISSQGRFIWCDEPLQIVIQNRSLQASSSMAPVTHGRAGSTLRDAYLHVSRNHFPASGTLPDERLFRAPVYTSWIELGYNQNQEGILEYARGALEHGFPSGVMIIDDNWQRDYGEWEFRAERFDAPGVMIDALKQMGFPVMLWVCPFVSPDSETGRELARRHWLVGADINLRTPALIRWWNGYSSALDLTNPDAMDWFVEQLERLRTTYGVEGFKFDGGDARFYSGDVYFSEDVHPNVLTEQFGRLGLRYPLNEFRAAWKMGGQPLVQRLRDKRHSWGDLQSLIPGVLAQGLMGYPYSGPDLIGGGEIRSFQHLDTMDPELIVRSAQCHALMPMMQFSVAPWRVLEGAHLEAVREAAWLHVRMADRLVALAEEAAHSGEPVVRAMDYVFPGQGFERVTDQFLVGEDILVAPVLTAGAREREVRFPPGLWKDDQGRVYEGPRREKILAPLERLPLFLRIQ